MTTRIDAALPALVLALALAPFGALSPQTANAGACAPPTPYPRVLTRRVPSGGGVVVGLTADGASPSLFAAYTRTTFDTLELRAIDDSPDVPLAFRREELAPGLARFVPARDLTGTLAIDTGADEEPIVLRTGRSLRPPAAPRVRSVGVAPALGYLEARLRSAIPRGVIAAIIHGYDASGARRALGWTSLRGVRGRSFALPESGGRCGPLPPGFEPITGRAPDARIEITFVDEGGGVSPPSAPVTPESVAL